MTDRACNLRIASYAIFICVVVGTVGLRFAQVEHSPPTRTVTDFARERVSKEQILSTDVRYSVGIDSDQRWILGRGFLHPDAAGAWLAQRTGELNLALHPEENPASLEIWVEPLLGQGIQTRSVSVHTSVDSVEIGLQGGIQPVLVALDGQSTQSITIICDGTSAPIDLAIGPDRRKFCARLSNVRVNSGG